MTDLATLLKKNEAGNHMSSPKAFSPDMDLFLATTQEVMLRLQGAHSERQLFDVLRWFAEAMDREFIRSRPKNKSAVACHAGCDYCCQVPLGVQAHEVLLAAEHIKQHFSQDELAITIANTAAHRTRVAKMTVSEFWTSVQPCALLREGRCSIYLSRPEVCRAHHGSDSRICKSNLSNHSKAMQSTELLDLRGRLFGMMLGIDQAVAEAGFDGRAYDFGSALHEALTNSSCAYLWARKMQTFPDSCRESPAEEGGECGEVHAGIFT